jgi:hypothetical protein
VNGSKQIFCLCLFAGIMSDKTVGNRQIISECGEGIWATGDFLTMTLSFYMPN